MRSKTVRLGLALLVAATSVLIAACGGGGDGGGGGGGGNNSGGKVRLSYAYWNEQQGPALRKVVQRFESQNPGVTVSLQLTPFDQYFTKLQTAASAGNAPDVFWLNGPTFPLYAAEGQLLEMGDVDASPYPEQLVKTYTWDGKLYGVPRDFDTIGLWYNKRLFDAAGVDHPDGSWTWEDVRSAAEKLTDDKRRVWGIAAAQKDQEGFYNTIAQAGGYVISPDGKRSGYADPQTIEGIRFWIDLIKAGVSPSAQQMVDTEFNDLFASEKVAMIFGGSWRAIEFEGNDDLRGHIGVAPLPAGPEGKATVLHGLANVVSAKTEHPEEATKLATYMGGEEAARIMAETGAVIPAYQGTQEGWVKAYPKLTLQPLLDQVADGVPMPASRNTAAWKQDETDILAQVWAGRLSPEEGGRKLADAMQAKLDQEQP